LPSTYAVSSHCVSFNSEGFTEPIDRINSYISLAGNHNVLEDILWTKYFHLYASKYLEFQIAEESGVEGFNI